MQDNNLLLQKCSYEIHNFDLTALNRKNIVKNMSQIALTVLSYHLTRLMLFSYRVINRAYNWDSWLIVRARICSEKCTELNMTQIEIFKILKKQMHGVGEY